MASRSQQVRRASRGPGAGCHPVDPRVGSGRGAVLRAWRHGAGAVLAVRPLPSSLPLTLWASPARPCPRPPVRGPPAPSAPSPLAAPRYSSFFLDGHRTTPCQVHLASVPFGDQPVPSFRSVLCSRRGWCCRGAHGLPLWSPGNGRVRAHGHWTELGSQSRTARGRGCRVLLARARPLTLLSCLPPASRAASLQVVLEVGARKWTPRASRHPHAVTRFH